MLDGVNYNYVIRNDSVSASKKNVDVNNDTNMIKQYLDEIKKIRDRLIDEDDKELMEYEAIKLFYIALYHNYRYCKIKTKIKAYRTMRSYFLEYNKDYKKNKYINLKKTNPVRSYAQKIIFFSILLEKMKLMPLALVGYHIISKIHYFSM